MANEHYDGIDKKDGLVTARIKHDTLRGEATRYMTAEQLSAEIRRAYDSGRYDNAAQLGEALDAVRNAQGNEGRKGHKVSIGHRYDKASTKGKAAKKRDTDWQNGY